MVAIYSVHQVERLPLHALTSSRLSGGASTRLDLRMFFSAFPHSHLLHHYGHSGSPPLFSCDLCSLLLFSLWSAHMPFTGAPQAVFAAGQEQLAASIRPHHSPYSLSDGLWELQHLCLFGATFVTFHVPRLAMRALTGHFFALRATVSTLTLALQLLLVRPLLSSSPSILSVFWWALVTMGCLCQSGAMSGLTGFLC